MLKLGDDVLLKIIDIVREGLVESKDISQQLRDLSLWADEDESLIHLDIKGEN